MSGKISFKGLINYLFIYEEAIPIEELYIAEEDEKPTTSRKKSNSKSEKIDKFFVFANYVLGTVLAVSFLALLYSAIIMGNNDSLIRIGNAFTLTLGWFLNASLQYVKKSLE